MLNNAPIYWHSKKQTSVEMSTFGSEMMSMKQAADYIRGFRYKLRMFGIPVEDPSYITVTISQYLRYQQDLSLI